MAFFKQFPKVDYDFNNQGINQKLTDIFRSVRVLPTFIDDFSAYKFYEIKNGERPDVVSLRLYGSSAYYWTFFVINDFLHDGYRAWPMSQEQFYDYINKEYEGYVIETHPEIVKTGDGIITDFKNSIAGRFTLGEQIRGATSGAIGTLTKKHIDMNQLIIQNVTGAFVGDPDAIPNVTELIIGQSSGDSVSTYDVWKFADAPYYYYDENDGNKKPVSSASHFSDASTGGVARSDLAYITYRDHEFELNEERSKIRYVDPNYIGQFVDKFEEAINV